MTLGFGIVPRSQEKKFVARKERRPAEGFSRGTTWSPGFEPASPDSRWNRAWPIDEIQLVLPSETTEGQEEDSERIYDEETNRQRLLE